MTEQALKELVSNAEKTIFHSFPVELRIGEMDQTEEGQPKTLWRMPLTGEIVNPGTKGAGEWRRWWATISTEKSHLHKEVIERNAVETGFLEWMTNGGGNVRYMHLPQPVGRIFDGDYEITESGIVAGFSIPVRETKAIQQIEDGLIRCVSIGFNPDWRKSEPIIWESDGTIRWKWIMFVEISIGDFGATPGTDFLEERIANNKQLSPGAAPENHKSSTTEDIDLDEAKLKEILSGALTPITDRMDSLEQKVSAVQTQPPTPKPETPAPETPPPAAPPQQGEMEQRLTKLEQGLGAIVGSLEKLGTGTNGQQTGQTIEQRVAAFEEEVKKTAAEPNHNAPLSFIKCDDGQPLTIERLAGDLRRG